MHLKAIKIRGFKSFPDPVEVRLERGVAVVVGPNGSGKSNIADAIVWASGSLTPSELRAEKPDDVLFGGSAERPAVDSCEVELLFDNADGDGPLDYSELAVTRRLQRGGEGQYLVNRATVRRVDLVDLLSDLGLGHGMHSIIGQGRVDEVLTSRPADRRTLVEEAAGLGKFKRRRHRAELKLARVQVQIERARDLETEVRKRLRPLAMQASAAERAEKLRGQITALEARLAEMDLAAIAERRAEAEQRHEAARRTQAQARAELERLLGEREQAEKELEEAAGGSERALAQLYRLRGALERLEIRREAAQELGEEFAALLERSRENAAAEPAVAIDEADLARARARAGLERARDAAVARTRETSLELDRLRERARDTAERLGALERALEEREGIPPAARALSEAGERLTLSLLEVEPGYEKAVTAALSWRAASVMTGEPGRALELLEEARRRGLGALAVVLPPEASGEMPEAPVEGAHPLRDFVSGDERARALLGGVWVVELERLTEARSGVVVSREGHGYDAARGEMWFSGGAAEAVLLELDARRRALAAEAARLVEEVGAAEQSLEAAQRRAQDASSELAAIPPSAFEPPRARALPSEAGCARLCAASERLLETLGGIAGLIERLETPLRERAETGAGRSSELGASLRQLGAEEAALRERTSVESERLAQVSVELARLDSEREEAARRAGGGGVEPAEGDDREELERTLERGRKRLGDLGRVNPLAKEEYEEEKARAAELEAQRADLEQSLAELEKLRAELTATIERRFAETYELVSGTFVEVAATLFPGGEGILCLTEPEAGSDEEPGIEIELRPAGKRISKLSLLSGGEKALGAICFLFALFLAHPCPFYLLDEVEAALDDSNIGRFVELLRRYADRAQFVVITHQKRTMEAADLLYGVTMSGNGVSQIVSRRTPREQENLASA